MPATPGWLAALEGLINRGIQASLQATALARRLEATALRVDIEGVISIRSSMAGGRMALSTIERSTGRPAAAGDADTANATIAGSPFALLQMAGARGRGATPRPARGATQVRGDAEIANSYRQLLMLARPDLEEELSRVVGDLAARRITRFGRRVLVWARGVRSTAGENIAEYLQEESRDVVSRSELEEFLRGVDELREAADRAAARIARLDALREGSAR